jgi:hypothetical protein
MARMGDEGKAVGRVLPTALPFEHPFVGLYILTRPCLFRDQIDGTLRKT